ncbi:MAG TPA: hypothetical protein PKA00_01390 [Saprospiraceae bacterium]|nr:hypothetical protein [Saprospiraceae bacterium]HMQ81522.1 hypothetical protein [Saprospiraceae bacterium]
MTLTNLQEKIRGLIVQDRLDLAFQELNASLENGQPRDEFIQLARKHKKLQKDFDLGLLKTEDFNLKDSRVVKSLFSMLDDLQEADIKADLDLSRGIFEKILVLVGDKAVHAEIQALLHPDTFKNVAFASHPVSEEALAVDVLVFCHQRGQAGYEEADCRALVDAHPGLLYVLFTPDLLGFLRPGPENPKAEFYRARVNPANSYMTLPARLREAIDYLRLKRGLGV